MTTTLPSDQPHPTGQATQATPAGQTTPNTTTSAITIRPFDGEYEALIAIQKAIDPDESGDVAGWRFQDESWPKEKYFRLRLVAQTPDGQIVGWGQVQHMRWQFHPDKYGLDLDVHPAHQRRGIGTALFQALLAPLRERGAACVRTAVKESRGKGIDFVTHRDFVEIQRYWESRLDVAGFDFVAFSTAENRAAEQGIRITTLAAALAAHGEDEAMLRGVYEMDQAAFVDVPFPDPPTPAPYDEWRMDVLKSPNSLHDAFFLALDGERYVGISNMFKNPEYPDVLHQGFTGVIPAYRGKGVAMALKMQTVKYARDHHYREIRTGNNTRNRPMLRINEAMGFVKQPVWVEYEKDLKG